jgi:hypothetical protein
MHPAYVIALAAGLYVFYAALLTTWSIVRDDTLTLIGKAARVVIAWCLPLVGPLFLLRAAAEIAPRSLPPRAFLVPLLPLVYIRTRQPNDPYYAEHDTLGVSGGDIGHDQGDHS